jgi:SAM-dependent MidA family methyltransferase
LEAAASRAGKNLIVFGNEFFDALPVEVIDYLGAVRVGFEGERFVESFVAPSAAEQEFLDRYSVHPEEGERVEAALLSLAWMDRIADAFRERRGFAIFIDYGYTREEQLAGRHRDTLLRYRRHVATPSPSEAPGEQDITAHVNFTALGARGIARGLDELALLTQSQFLLGIGEETEFADAFQDCRFPQERAKVALQLKHLISPGGMGETFQVLLMSHNVAKEKAASLGGLRSAR